jgi:hypothetical protein
MTPFYGGLIYLPYFGLLYREKIGNPVRLHTRICGTTAIPRMMFPK